MKTISETASAQNLTSFEQLVSYLSSYPVNFKIKSKSINYKTLQKLSYEAKEASRKVALLTDEYCKALTNRENAFDSISKIGNALIEMPFSLNLSPEIIKLCKKLRVFTCISQDTLKTMKLEVKETGKYLLEVDHLEAKYDKTIIAFSVLVNTLASTSNYQPTENFLQIPLLKETLSNIVTTQKTLKEIRSEIVKARMGRSTILYKTDDGLVDIAHDTKVFIKKTFGGESKQWEKVSAIDFRRQK